MTLQDIIAALQAEGAQSLTVFQNGRILLTHARRCYPFDSVADFERATTQAPAVPAMECGSPLPLSHPHSTPVNPS